MTFLNALYLAPLLTISYWVTTPTVWSMSFFIGWKPKMMSWEVFVPMEEKPSLTSFWSLSRPSLRQMDQSKHWRIEIASYFFSCKCYTLWQMNHMRSVTWSETGTKNNLKSTIIVHLLIKNHVLVFIAGWKKSSNDHQCLVGSRMGRWIAHMESGWFWWHPPNSNTLWPHLATRHCAI